MKIVVSMAGLGSRFQKAADTNPEYKKPKPLISVKGIPMVRWATGSLPFIEHPGQSVHSPLRATPSDLIFIILKEHDDAYQVEKHLKEIYSDAIKVIVLPALTRGASETAYQARPFIAPDEELIILDCDHYFDGQKLEETLLRHRGLDVAGVIPVFVPPSDTIPHWSYALTEPNGTRIIQIGEKDRALMEAGAYANIGAYCFFRAQFFFSAFEKAREENKMTGEEGKKELYIAPLYQELLDEGRHLEIALLSEVWSLGTPDDLERFLKNCSKNAP